MDSHDRVTDNLEKILRDTPIKEKNVLYGNKHRYIGEIDLLMYDNGVLWLFEVKSNEKQYKKAKDQLNRAEKFYAQKYFPYHVHTVKKFIVIGNRKTDYIPTIRWIP